MEREGGWEFFRLVTALKICVCSNVWWEFYTLSKNVAGYIITLWVHRDVKEVKQARI